MNNPSPLNITLTDRKDGVTITEWVYVNLRNAVMSGQILPGRSLTIRELASALNVSPMPIREALKKLGTERALEVRENRRILVPKMTAMKFNELCDTRIALESHAAARALPYIDSQRLEELERLDLEIDKAHDINDVEAGIQRNQAFHRQLYCANPHQVSLPLIESLWLQLGPFLRLANSQLEEHYLIDRHQEALQAIRNKDTLALQLAIAADIREGIAFAGTPELLHQFIATASLS
ncbi:GntR family transcriptional regulator [Marinomonas pollencensis]|uniref:GntR family transcriptional regulator n=1 Tax=Marinomonas pollencensis TaxID=491954 RepID=A0A3E0DSZ1_9GAMM|nr:GntR family transcriptional regulator [Marinomonas pollencensis]REG86667.1 GntR family transcriptional regulator [Marinomonas pollencensis]